MTETQRDSFDVIIVGGGSAGCVLANRLSADGARTLLLEAGRDIPPGQVPGDIADTYPRSYSNPNYMWSGLTADAGPGGKTDPLPQARIMGGGSSVMGMIAMRGLPADYDGWASGGADGWSWDDVLPSFRRLENDWEFDGPLHGKSGPIPIRRHPVEDWPVFDRAVGEAAHRMGFPMVDDMNADFRDGHCRLPLSATLSHRASTASAYLTRDVRSRPNLSIAAETLVERLCFDGARCTGVEAVANGKRLRFHGEQVVVCAGAINSPALLLRSGIGPEADLRRLSIDTVASNPAVGQGLQNHSVLYLATHLKPDARQSPLLRPQFNSALRFSSPSAKAAGEQGDMIMLVVSKSSWHGLGQTIAGLGIGLFSPDSRGEVRLRSADPAIPPSVKFRLLSDERDRQRMIDGLRLASDLMASPEVAPVHNDVFTAGYSEAVRRLNRSSRVNNAATKGLARLIDGPKPVRKAFVRFGISRGERSHQIGTPEWLQNSVDERSFMMYHPTSTCAIGGADSDSGVVTPDCRVKGVEGLSVVDASIMPAVPRGNTNIPTVMIAERAGEMILKR